MIKVRINVKSVANKKNSIEQLEYEYMNTIKTLEDFICETVKITHERYLKALEETERFDEFSSFNWIKGGVCDVNSAVKTAIEGFVDGLVVIFIDGCQYDGDDLKKEISITDGSEVTFVKLTFLG